MDEVRVQIKAIRAKLKPSCLWEISFADPCDIVKLYSVNGIDLTSLFIIHFTASDLKFIADLQLTIDTINFTLNRTDLFVVNTNPRLECPKLLTNDEIKTKHAVLQMIKDCLVVKGFQHEDKIIKIDNTIDDMCLINGIMLGYPVVYSNVTSQDGNNLSMVPLNVVKVAFDSKSIPFYSFSYPASFTSNFESTIDQWLKQLNYKCSALYYLQDVVTSPLILN